jgi:hypothetical protein
VERHRRRVVDLRIGVLYRTVAIRTPRATDADTELEPIAIDPVPDRARERRDLNDRLLPTRVPLERQIETDGDVLIVLPREALLLGRDLERQATPRSLFGLDEQIEPRRRRRQGSERLRRKLEHEALVIL